MTAHKISPSIYKKGTFASPDCRSFSPNPSKRGVKRVMRKIVKRKQYRMNGEFFKFVIFTKTSRKWFKLFISKNLTFTFIMFTIIFEHIQTLSHMRGFSKFKDWIS